MRTRSPAAPRNVSLQLRRQRIEQRLRHGLRQLQACRFFVQSAGLAREPAPACARARHCRGRSAASPTGPHRTADRTSSPPASRLPSSRVRAAGRARANSAAAAGGSDRSHRAAACWLVRMCSNTAAGRSPCVGTSRRAAARECRRAQRDARDCRAPRRAARCRRRGSCPTARRSAAAVACGLHSLSDGDRLVALEAWPMSGWASAVLPGTSTQAAPRPLHSGAALAAAGAAAQHKLQAARSTRISQAEGRRASAQRWNRARRSRRRDRRCRCRTSSRWLGR